MPPWGGSGDRTAPWRPELKSRETRPQPLLLVLLPLQLRFALLPRAAATCWAPAPTQALHSPSRCYCHSRGEVRLKRNWGRGQREGR